MGQSTDALLWYGVAFDESHDDGDELATKIHDVIYGEDEDLYGDGREWLAEQGLTGQVEFVEHCSGEYPMYGIAVAGSVTKARRGGPKQVDVSFDHDGGPVIAALKALDGPTGEPLGWCLASMWN